MTTEVNNIAIVQIQGRPDVRISELNGRKLKKQWEDDTLPDIVCLSEDISIARKMIQGISIVRNPD